MAPQRSGADGLEVSVRLASLLNKTDGTTYLPRSKAKIPFWIRIFLPGQSVDLIVRNVGQRFEGVPALCQVRFDSRRGHFEVQEKIGVGAVQSVGWVF